MSEQDATSEQTDSLGRRFQTARVSQGMTIGQMSAITRIQEEALRDLEEDRFDRLFSLVFAKGKVRSYARALNLDEVHCVRLFSECAVSFDKKNEEQPLMFPMTPIVEDEHKGKFRRYMLVILACVLLLVLLRVSTPSPSIPSTPTTAQQALVPHGRAGAVSASMIETNERADANAGPVTSLSPPSASVVVEGSTPVLVAGP